MFNAYLKLGDVKGESTMATHKDEIQVDSFNLGAMQQVDSSVSAGRGAGAVELSNFNMSKSTDKASPLLFQACCRGTHFPEAVVSVCKAGGKQECYLKYKFYDVMITDVNWSGGGSDAPPSETFSLNFGKFEMEYKPQKPDGTLGGAVVASYDVNKQE